LQPDIDAEEPEEPQRPDFGWPHPGAFAPQEIEWVLKLRKEEGLSLRAIGEITGRSFSHIDRLEQLAQEMRTRLKSHY
jgi:hypothetical protein